MKVRNDWSLAEVQSLFALPFLDLLFDAQRVHRHFQVPNTVQVSTLISLKTGACPGTVPIARKAYALTPDWRCRS